MLMESLYGLGVGLALGMTGGGGVLAVLALVLGLGYSSQRDAQLDMPNLLLPSIQVNIRAGVLPEPESNGVRYLKMPIDVL